MDIHATAAFAMDVVDVGRFTTYKPGDYEGGLERKEEITPAYARKAFLFDRQLLLLRVVDLLIPH